VNAVPKRKIPSPRRDSNPDLPALPARGSSVVIPTELPLALTSETVQYHILRYKLCKVEFLSLASTKENRASLQVFMVVKIQVKDFLVVTPYSVVVGYQRFGGTCCLIFRVK
jgi:hypothetical protein